MVEIGSGAEGYLAMTYWRQERKPGEDYAEYLRPDRLSNFFLMLTIVSLVALVGLLAL